MAETRTANRNVHRRNDLGDPIPAENRPWSVEGMEQQFPEHTRDQVAEALSQCQQELGTEDRTKVMDCMMSKLSMRDAQ